MPKHILIINGPNLNLLGTREPQHYGADTLAGINARLDAVAAELGVRVSHFQHNGEGDIVSRIHAARADTDMVVINAGAYTHTSIAIRDALAGTGLPFVEVHLSNVYRREPFRHHSYLADLAEGVIAGLGAYGYEAALRFAAARLGGTEDKP